MRTAPYFAVISLKNSRKPGFGGTSPILAATGSTTSAPISSGNSENSFLTESSSLYLANNVCWV